ncbi:MAG: hypothetical protein AB4290_20735 [Spirulina sp.]
MPPRWVSLRQGTRRRIVLGVKGRMTIAAVKNPAIEQMCEE